MDVSSLIASDSEFLSKNAIEQFAQKYHFLYEMNVKKAPETRILKSALMQASFLMLPFSKVVERVTIADGIVVGDLLIKSFTSIYPDVQSYAYCSARLKDASLEGIQLLPVGENIKIMGIPLTKTPIDLADRLTISAEFDLHYATKATPQQGELLKKIFVPEVQQAFIEAAQASGKRLQLFPQIFVKDGFMICYSFASLNNPPFARAFMLLAYQLGMLGGDL